MTTPAFLTGSRVYGTPRDTSDVDLVILCDRETKDLLYQHRDKVLQEVGTPVIRYGNLNLIAVTCEDTYLAWKDARDECLREAPVTRDRAVEIHKEHLGPVQQSGR